MTKYKIAFISTSDYAHKRVIEEIEKLGHEFTVIEPQNLSVSISTNRKTLLNKGEKIEADIIIHKMSTDFRDGLVCLESVKNQYIIINMPEAVLCSANKFLSASRFFDNNIQIPISTFTQNDDDIEITLNIYGIPLIFKQPDGAEGNQVVLVEARQELEVKLIEVRERGKVLISQEFIEESFGQDLRVIVVGNQVIAAMKRVQTDPNEFRANIHKGAIGERIELTEEEKEIAINAAKAIGLDFAGVDILRSKRGPLVLETNSFPGLEGIEKATSQNVAKDIVESMIKLAENKLSLIV